MATIHFRRYTTRHNIEVLTTSSIAPTIHAIWIPQCKLKANGEKALTYDDLQKALEGSKDVKIANLATGQWVDKGKFTAKQAD